MTNAMKARREHKDAFEEIHGARLGFMSFFAKASSQALMDTPSVNAYIDDETNEIVYRHYVDISVAVASPRGLVVPVLRNVESMDFAAVEKSISKFGKKAQNDEITMEDMTGGTFTISNGGVFGSMMGTPILNPPQSAILGMHAIKQRPVVVNNEIVARPIMFLALTYDHRLIDGREAVTFLKSVCNYVENPTRLLLGV
jgi:2-oxoglutarate dehydrogenase E2 component (dihydrolipoamide succinyltransferase)